MDDNAEYHISIEHIEMKQSIDLLRSSIDRLVDLLMTSQSEANLWDDLPANTRYDDRLGRFRCVLLPSYKQSPSKDSDVWWE